QLVAACRAGDHGAWAELVERYSRYVYAIAVRAYGLAESDAEDVFQEVFARTYERLGDLRDDAAIKPWLAQTTRRLAIDHLRAALRRRGARGAARRPAARARRVGPRGPGARPARALRRAARGRRRRAAAIPGRALRQRRRWSRRGSRRGWAATDRRSPSATCA